MCSYIAIMALPRKAALALTLIGLTTSAFAQPSPSDPPTTTPVSPDRPGSKPDIATPDANANPDKVNEAKEVAKKAALTPLIPSPNNPTQPAFQLYLQIDPPILAVGTVFALARLVKTQPAYCAPQCDSSSLNAIDKLTAGYYSAGWSSASDFALYGLGAIAAGLLISDEGVLDALNDGVVIAESTLGATAVASIMTLAAGRPRPFLYSTKAPLSVRNSADAGESFLSSHTAMAFAITTSLYVTEKRLHPTSARSKIILGAGLALSSFIGVARIEAGYHFITDVVGGAVVGASLGVLIASIHNSPVHVVPVVSDTQKGVGISGSF